MKKTITHNIILRSIITLLVLFANVNIANASLIDNIVAYWKLDEASGNAADSVGSNTLVNTGSAGYSAGWINNGVDMGSGNTAKSLLVASSLVSQASAYSVAISGKAPAEISAGSWPLFQIVDDTNNDFSRVYYEYNGGTRRLVFVRARSGVAFDTGTYNVTLGTTRHDILFTYNGTSTVNLYLDNILVATVASTGNGNTSSLANQFSIGAQSNVTSTTIDDWGDFSIDEVGVWDKEVPSEEVSQRWNGGVGLQYPFTPASTSSAGRFLGFFKFFRFR